VTDAVRAAPPRLVVTAAAGYGKSTLLEVLRPEGGVVTSARSVAGSGLPDGAAWVGLDDADRLDADALEALYRELARRTDVDVVVTAREPVDSDLRAAVGGRWARWDATDLALSPWDVARTLRDECGVDDPEAALRVADLTAGWALLVHFAGDALRRDGGVDLVSALTSPGTPAADWVRSAVLDPLPDDALDILRQVVRVDATAPVTAAVCDAIRDAAGRERAPGLLDGLRRAGVLVPARRPWSSTGPVVVPLVATVLRGGGGRDVSARTMRTARMLARVHEGEGAWMPATRAYAVSAQPESALRIVCAHGEELLRAGAAADVVDIVDRAVGSRLGEQPDLLRRTHADALRMSGDVQQARRAFAPLAADAHGKGWSAGLAARVAALHYLDGAFGSALDVLERCPQDPPPGQGASADEELVDWSACRVHVLSVLGQPQGARSAAAWCLERAEQHGGARPLGVAHLAMARTSMGELAGLHLEQAARHATVAGDAVTLTRILDAQTYRHLASARYDRAVVTGRDAVRLARLSCPPGLQAAALHNLGEALSRVGDLDEALWHLECSIALCRRLGPARAALGLVGSAAVHRSLGREEQSRAAYGEAVDLARGSGDAQVLVQALSGLAVLVAAESPAEAERAVEEALALASPDLAAIALTASGRVALARGDRTRAAAQAAQAVSAARAERSADLLADALELEAAATEDPERARRALGEALSIWRCGGAEPAAARVEVLIGRLPDADGTERSTARDAVRSLRRRGIPTTEPRPVGVDGGLVAIRVLGPFAVSVDGDEVPLTAWRSKQARTLVKILAAQRGRVLTRARLCDLLWPDDDPARTGHRLSVLLATVRGVLDPDKAWPVDRYLTADQWGVRLALGAVTLDADELLRDAAHATALLEAGDTHRAREVLTHVDQLHQGEAFEDECDEWADALREEVRSAWMRSVRRLATLQSRQGRGAEAVGIFVRLLAIDPYDEQVHRALVRTLVNAGRHGEARRAFQRWCRAMSEIDAPPPDPHTVEPDPPDPTARRRPKPVLTPR